MTDESDRIAVLRLTKEEYGILLCMWTIATGLMVQDDALTIAAVTLLKHQLGIMGDRFESLVKQLEAVSNELISEEVDPDTIVGFSKLTDILMEQPEDLVEKLRGMFGVNIKDEDLLH